MNYFYVKTRYDRPYSEMIVEEDTYLPALLGGFGSMKLPDENILYRVLWLKTVDGDWVEYSQSHSGNDYCIAFPEEDIHDWIEVYESNEDSFLPPSFSVRAFI